MNIDHNIITDNTRVPIRMWTQGVPVEEEAIQQLRNVANMPFTFKHVAAMPDVHWGMGATVGSVIATKGAVIPTAVGVDIGCGMMACKLNLTASDLPDNLFGIRSAIEAAIPHGRTDNGGANDRGAWGYMSPDKHTVAAYNSLVGDLRYQRMLSHGRHPDLLGKTRVNPMRHMGTLGTGNHFIELCLDESNDVWIMLHSGSRGIGNRIGTYFIEAAKRDMERWFIQLPDKDLSYIPEGSTLFGDYCDAVSWAQDYAMENRRSMMRAALRAVFGVLERSIEVADGDNFAVNCHHNYISRENHYGQNVLVTRKGAVRAREGDLGIIPGSMGARSFIVRGKGNKESFCSCSHGAGRKMSRGEAKRTITLEQHIAATKDVECRKDNDVIDESPAAYKDIDAVMNAQRNLVEIVHTLRQVICVKG